MEQVLAIFEIRVSSSCGSVSVGNFLEGCLPAAVEQVLSIFEKDVSKLQLSKCW